MWLLVTVLGILFANVFVTTELHNATSTENINYLPKTGSHGNETDRYLEKSSNFTVMFNETWIEMSNLNVTNGTETRNVTETDDNIFGSLSALKRLISKTYWEQRIQDPYYLSEAFIPFCAGILVSWLLILVFCTLKCCCGKKNKRNKLLRIKTIKNDSKKDGSQWMLLEKNSSDEEI